MTVDERLWILAAAAALFVASVVYLLVAIRRSGRAGTASPAAAGSARSVDVGVDLHRIAEETPQGFRRILEQPLRTGEWMPEDEDGGGQVRAVTSPPAAPAALPEPPAAVSSPPAPAPPTPSRPPVPEAPAPPTAQSPVLGVPVPSREPPVPEAPARESSHPAGASDVPSPSPASPPATAPAGAGGSSAATPQDAEREERSGSVPKASRSLEEALEPYGTSGSPSGEAPTAETEGAGADVVAGAAGPAAAPRSLPVLERGAAASTEAQAPHTAPASGPEHTSSPVPGVGDRPAEPPDVLEILSEKLLERLGEQGIPTVAPAAASAPGPVEAPAARAAAESVRAPLPAPAARLPAPAASPPRHVPPAGPEAPPALKPEPAAADSRTEEYVMVSPVEMWFGEIRVGVRPGSKTFEEFQRLAARMLHRMPGARRSDTSET
ncbi:MAG: hypothetical protein IBX62_02875 [Coriobacteriia bacterium]|nr:hypothetical protein [Coriobacteriia bacterium]